MEKKKLNVILTVEESEEMKEFCIKHGIKWFRTEYWDKRYFEVEVDEEQEEMIEKLLGEMIERSKKNEKMDSVM